MLIDTHAHVNFNAYKNDADDVIRRSLAENVWMINVGSKYTTSRKAVEIAETYPQGVFAAIGLHPINLDTGLIKIKGDESEDGHLEKEFDYKAYRELGKSKKVVAVGEIGLDYYWKPKTTKKKELFKQKQRELFLKELELAKELNLPVIFHCRMAHEDLLEILNYRLKPINYKLRGVMHGFVGTLEQLREYFKMGFYIGFNGIIFKQIEGVNFKECIKETPLNRILIETDCPYLLPSVALIRDSLGSDRNEPIYVKYVAQKIAEIKNVSFERVAKSTSDNAKLLFRLKEN